MKQIRPSANQTRQKILLAAKKCFLKKGYDATYIKDIAKLANVNTNLIFHHYVNKKTLWHKVKESILDQEVETANYETSNAKVFFASILDYRFRLYSNHPDLARLIQWQQMTNDEKLLAGSMRNSPEKLFHIVNNFQKNGEISDHLSAEQIILFVIHSTYGPFLQKVIFLNKAQVEAYKKMLLDMCCREFLI